MTAATTPKAGEIILATSPAGNAAMHVYDPAGRIIETQAGMVEELRNYAASRYPETHVTEINR